jgi:hypothetical protein
MGLLESREPQKGANETLIARPQGKTFLSQKLVIKPLL